MTDPREQAIARLRAHVEACTNIPHYDGGANVDDIALLLTEAEQGDRALCVAADYPEVTRYYTEPGCAACELERERLLLTDAEPVAWKDLVPNTGATDG